MEKEKSETPEISDKEKTKTPELAEKEKSITADEQMVKEKTSEIIEKEKMASRNNDINIPLFDGSEYKNWKVRMFKFLQFKKCNEVVLRARTDSDDETWTEKDIQATNYIYSAITNKQLEYISDLESAYDIISKFDSMYLKVSTALQIVCRHNLENLKLKNYTDVTLFCDDFEKAMNELKQAGATISEQEKLNYMLKSLPPSYSHIGDLIDVLPEKERTVDYLISKIKLKSAEEKSNEATHDRSNAFRAEAKPSPSYHKSVNCYNCGKPSHLQRDCPESTGYNRRGRGTSRGRGSYNSRSFNRGRGQYNYQQRQSYERHGNSFHTTIANNTTTEDTKETVKKGQIEWILDSGCTDHIINTDKYFENCETLKNPVKVKIGDGRMLEATKVGNIKAYFSVYGQRSEIELKNVFYVQEMKANLLSYSRITDKNSIESKGRVSKIYNPYGDLIAVAIKKERLYKMRSFINEVQMKANISNKQDMTVKEKLHRKLGHINFHNLEIMCKNKSLDGLPEEIESKFLKCATCIENKMHNLPFQNNRRKAEDILQIVHTDLNGPHQTTGNRGEKYFLSFIDDYSKLVKVYCIRTKDEVYDCLVQYVNEVENITDKKVKELRCDNGTEFINAKVFQFTKEKGILIRPCPAYVHELNGTAERYHRSLMDMGRCLLAEAKVERKYWPEIIKTAAYLKNRTLTNTVERKTPYEIFFKTKPTVKYLKMYGSKVFVRIPEEKRKSKWDKKAEAGILLGYSDTGYRVLINNKVILARHCDIIEEDVTLCGFEDESGMSEVGKDTKTEITEHPDETTSDEVKSNNDIEIEKHQEVEKRRRKPPLRFDEEYGYYCITANYCDATNPETFQEALTCKDSSKWKTAMDREMESLVTNKTWTLVDKPPKDKKVIDVKWVYTKKSETEYKARLVVRGFQQTDYVDDTYSPVAKMPTLKLLLSYCCQNSLEINQMDVETAFLNGKVVSKVYVKQPIGYEIGTDKVYLLLKSLYGLKESPRAWYECFNEFLTSLGFRRSKYDYCLYYKKNKDLPVYILLFVDDLLICCRDYKIIDDIKSKLSDRFKMKDLGKVKNYIGIVIEYNYEQDNILTLSQEHYIESLAKRYNIENSKLYKTPMEINLKLEKTELNEDVKYRNLIGALLYVSSGTRSDISFCVNYLSRFQNCCDETHYKYALRVLKYLYLTKNLKLKYYKNKDADILDCFVDSDWAGDIIDRKSTTGYIIRLFGNVILWKSKKQNCVTKSSTFAEYIALSEAVTEIKFLICLINDVFTQICKPVKIYEDNSGAVAIAKYGNFTKNSKHIEVQYHFIHESVKENLIEVLKIESEKNCADILTKSLGNNKFIKFREMLNINV